jgi:hypothetical protein
MSGRVRTRRIGLLVAAAAALGAIALPGSASAFDDHFSVISENVAGHQIPGGFAFRDALFNPANPVNKVGRVHARCKGDRGGKAHCKALVHLDGSVGGFGNLLVKGNFGHGDHTLNVVDGDGDFSGRIAGKMVIDGLDRRHDLLTFSLVG